MSWAKAGDVHLTRYRNALSSYLRLVKPPTAAITCRCMRCLDGSHLDAIEQYADSIIDACYRSGLDSIPPVSPPGKRIPGWSEHVEPFREKSIFWHNLWHDCGRPSNGTVADSMRRTRAAYHYAIRQVRRSEDSIVRDRLAQAVLTNKHRDFWREVRKIRANKSARNCVIDGRCDVNDVAQLFADKYRDLNSCVSCDQADMAGIVTSIDNQLLNNSSALFSHCLGGKPSHF